MKLIESQEYEREFTIILKAETPEEASMLARLALQSKRDVARVSVFFPKSGAPSLSIDVSKSMNREHTSTIYSGGRIE